MSSTSEPDKYEQHCNKLALLNNGGRVNLRRAAELFHTLQALTLNPDSKLELELLREKCCTGTAVQGDLRDQLKNIDLCDPSGHIPDDVRNVILSSMAGDMCNLHVVSPFMDYVDRRLADFISSIISFKENTKEDYVIQGLRKEVGEEWLNRIQKPPPGRGGFSRN